MHHLIQIWFGWVLSGGYPVIVLLMALGSTPLPVPAEAVIPPAAFLAAQGKLSFPGVVIAGTIGSYLGAALMYWASSVGGRPLLEKYGRFVLLSPHKLASAESWLARYGAGGIFFARLLPGIRHLISIPAGALRMNFAVFSVTTIAGSAISCAILAYLGREAFRVAPRLLESPEQMLDAIKTQSREVLLVVGALIVLYVVAMLLLNRRKARSV